MTHFFELADMCYLRRPEGMELELRVFLFELAKKTSIEAQAKSRMMTAL
jgi:hypothetical protein